MKTAGELMTKRVIAVNPDMPLIEAVNILLKYGLNGLPVVVGDLLVGIITEYDMIIKGSSVHLPTLIKLFNSIEQKDSYLIEGELKKILKAKVKDVMNQEPLTLNEADSIFKVVDTFGQHHKVNPVPILDKDKRLVGIISRSDILKFLGDRNVSLESEADQKEIDQNVKKFIDNFRGKFILVSKFRTRFWIIASVLFAILGFIIAWALVLNINF